MKYSLPVLRIARRVTVTSAKASGMGGVSPLGPAGRASVPSSLSSTSVTSAMPSGRRRSVPAKMMSSVRTPRRDRRLPSPSAQRIASKMLVLPLPFGPTTPVTWDENSIPVRSAKVLNPLSSRRFRRTPAPPSNHPPAPGPSLRLGRAHTRASAGAGASARRYGAGWTTACRLSSNAS